MDLTDAVVWNRIESVKAIIFGGSGVDVNDVDARGCIVLHRAAANGSVELGKILLDAKANVHIMDQYGTTPLHCASYSGHVDFVKLLITHKANVNAQPHAGKSALHWAALFGHITCVEEFIRAGAELNGQGDEGCTPLGYTIGYDFRGSTEILLDAGAKLSDVHVIPDWVETIIAKRKNVVASLRVFIGVMRNRFETEGPHVGNRVPKDLLKLLMAMLWSTRLDEEWEVK
jgi:ankyrin repeat protein